MKFKSITLVLSAALIFIYGNASGIEVVTEAAKLLASDGAAGDEFGKSVSISGNVALVGAENDDDKGSKSGSAYVFRWNGSSWVEEQKLLASDGSEEDEFGASVSISGDVALVGAVDEGSNSQEGSAYVYRWNGSSWVEEQKLLASDGAVGNVFGARVSISGNVALVGAAEDEQFPFGTGSAYVYRWNGSSWVEEQKLLASDGASRDRFGLAVSISGDVALVGAVTDDDKGSDSGSAYVFRWSDTSWVEEQKLLASDGAAGDEFGKSVSISGNVALVGTGDEETGSAYVFRWNGSSWVEEQKLLASDGAAGDEFGRSVSISGNVALVGARNDDDKGTNSGSAYVFRWNGSSWVEEQKLLASDGAAGDEFSSYQGVSFSGNRALVGAFRDDDKGTDSGSAYVYLINTPIPDVKANGSDGPITISTLDTLSVTVALQAGDLLSTNCDWWCAAQTPWKWYSYDYVTDQWLAGFRVTYMGPCEDIGTFEVLNMALPEGAYTFYFGVDDIMNGSFDGNQYYDSVDVTVTP
jgi:hypothetical protein